MAIQLTTKVPMEALARFRKAAGKSAHMMRALSDPTRVQAVLYLAFRECCTIGVCDLAHHLQIPPASMSYHLKVLWEAEILGRTRSKNTVTYWLTPDCLPLIQFLANIAESPALRPPPAHFWYFASRCHSSGCHAIFKRSFLRKPRLCLT